MKLTEWLERRRPAPLDVLAPAMQLGRLRTWMNAVAKRGQLRRFRGEAEARFAPLRTVIKTDGPIGRPSDRSARFAGHILTCARGRTEPIRYLEIGSFEGVSVAAVDALLRQHVRITVVDPFADYSENPDMAGVFEKFTANIKAVGAQDRTRVLKGRSIDELPKLIDAGEEFDIIYIDGSHTVLDVLLDTVLCWQLLARGGLMIFDDYWLRHPDLGWTYRPKLAIDAFVGAMSRDIVVADVGGQVFLRKRERETR